MGLSGLGFRILELVAELHGLGAETDAESSIKGIQTLVFIKGLEFRV